MAVAIVDLDRGSVMRVKMTFDIPMRMRRPAVDCRAANQ